MWQRMMGGLKAEGLSRTFESCQQPVSLEVVAEPQMRITALLTLAFSQCDLEQRMQLCQAWTTDPWKP